jgi:hypothetical protein
MWMLKVVNNLKYALIWEIKLTDSIGSRGDSNSDWKIVSMGRIVSRSWLVSWGTILPVGVAFKD